MFNLPNQSIYFLNLEKMYLSNKLYFYKYFKFFRNFIWYFSNKFASLVYQNYYSNMVWFTHSNFLLIKKLHSWQCFHKIEIVKKIIWEYTLYFVSNISLVYFHPRLFQRNLFMKYFFAWFIFYSWLYCDLLFLHFSQKPINEASHW